MKINNEFYGIQLEEGIDFSYKIGLLFQKEEAQYWYPRWEDQKESISTIISTFVMNGKDPDEAAFLTGKLLADISGMAVGAGTSAVGIGLQATGKAAVLATGGIAAPADAVAQVVGYVLVAGGTQVFTSSGKELTGNIREAAQNGSGGSEGYSETIPDLDKVDDSYLKKKEIDAHELKKDIYGKKAKVAEYDIYVDKKTGQLYTQRKPQYNKAGEPAISTGEYIK